MIVMMMPKKNIMCWWKSSWICPYARGREALTKRKKNPKNLCCRFLTFKILRKNCNMIFRKWGGGGGQRPFGTLPKFIHFGVATRLKYSGGCMTGVLCNNAEDWSIFPSPLAGKSALLLSNHVMKDPPNPRYTIVNLFPKTNSRALSLKISLQNRKKNKGRITNH